MSCLNSEKNGWGYCEIDYNEFECDECKEITYRKGVAHYCAYCGTEIDHNKLTFCPSCQDNLVYCPRFRFCPKCGESLCKHPETYVMMLSFAEEDLLVGVKLTDEKMDYDKIVPKSYLKTK